jgi:macrolide transport system ATP-binding/permease protein
VVIVSQAMARRLWPGRDPIGRRFKYRAPGSVANDWLTVVGVAGDTVRDGPETHPISVIYFPVRQKIWDVLALMVRTQSDPVAMETAIDDQIHLSKPEATQSTFSPRPCQSRHTVSDHGRGGS